MKTFFILCLTVVVFSSCKKNYVCSCTEPGGYSLKIPIEDAKKADAEEQCEKSSQAWASDGGGSCTLQ